MSDRAPRTGLLLFGLLVIGHPAAGAQDLYGTRAMGMGDSLRAAPTGESAVLLNPAGMTLTRSYVINALYAYRASDTGSLVNVSVVDSATKQIAAGLYYSFIHASPSRTFYNLSGGGSYALSETIAAHEVGVSIGYPIANLVHIGVTSKYTRISIEQPEDTPAELLESADDGFTMDIGAILKPFSSLNLGVVFSNAIPIDHDYYTRKLGLGIAYSLGTRMLAEFDAVLDFDVADTVKASYHGGAELLFGGSLVLRGGAAHDTFRDTTYVTGGLGLVTPKVALDCGLRQMVDGGAETMVAFSTRLFLQ